MDQLLACISQLDVINEMQREVMGGGGLPETLLKGDLLQGGAYFMPFTASSNALPGTEWMARYH